MHPQCQFQLGIAVELYLAPWLAPTREGHPRTLPTRRGDGAVDV